MKKLRFSIDINTSAKKLWQTMLDDKTYREWAKAFSSGSYYKGSWDKGSTIRFLGPDPKTGKESGMISKIVTIRPYEFVSIKHIGIIEDGREDRVSDEAKKWTPALENYKFIEKTGLTTLEIEVEVPDEYADSFTKMWQDGIQRLKKLAEK